MKKLKKVLVVSSLNMGQGGVEGGIRSYVSMFIENREDCTVDLLTVSNGPVKKIERVNNVYSVEVKGKPVCVFFYLKVIAMILSKKWRFGEYDAIVHNRYEDILASFLIQCKKRIVLIHGSGKYAFLFWPKIVAFFYFILEGVVLPRFDRIYVLLANEHYGVPYYRKRFSRIASRINYLPVPIADYFTKISKVKISGTFNSSGKLRIIYFGRVNNKPKNVLLFPEYVAYLKDYLDVQFTIAGDGDDVGVLKKVIKEKGLEKHFNFLGSCKHVDLPEIVGRHNLTMLLSSFEGICLTTLESIAVGIPVAAYPVGDIATYVHDMENGVLLDQNESVANNSQKIIRFLKYFNGMPSNFETVLKKYKISEAVYELEIE